MLFSCSNTKLKFSTFRKYPNSTWAKIAPHKLYIFIHIDLPRLFDVNFHFHRNRMAQLKVYVYRGVPG